MKRPRPFMRNRPGRILYRLQRPIVRFLETEASGGIVLILATVAALIWANSRFSGSYHDLWHTEVGFTFGARGLELSLHHWINDGLMAIFFLFVGLEIKREMLTGELATVKKAALPAMAALGGMLVPAAVYLAFNAGGPGSAGWGIPMATDIAFAIGILMLLGDRVPLGLKVFLTALAIVDDLGAVLVIALFYTSEISLVHLGWGLALLVLLGFLNLSGVRRTEIFLLVGIVVWYCFLKSGVHATVAGVMVALTVPHELGRTRRELVMRLEEVADQVAKPADGPKSDLDTETREAALQEVQELAHQAASPLMNLEHALSPWVAYVIMPVFALANAGVHLEGSALARAFTDPVPVGIVLGLFLGKQIGITGFSLLAVRLGWAGLPNRVGWRLLHGAAILGGIGFTMSLFIGNLAFAADPLRLEEAKMGILMASLISALAGTALLYLIREPKEAEAEEE